MGTLAASDIAREALFLTRDVRLINAFLNDPAIYPFCGFLKDGVADCTSRVADRDILFLTDGSAAMMCFHQHDGEWEKHNLFARACRGRRGINMGRAMIEWFQACEPGLPVTARTPISNRAARWFNRQIGMRSAGFATSPHVGPVEVFERAPTCQ